LQLVQLADYGARMPVQLSGGQQQRVALARALVIQPALLLLDEPLGALDKSLRQEMQVELRALQRRLGITTVLVTHDQDEALTMADRIAIMRDGRLEQAGAPADVYQRPDTRFVASFLGAANFFRGRVDRVTAQGVRVAVEGGAVLSVPAARPLGSPVTVALRPEAVMVEPLVADDAAPPNSAEAVLEEIVYHGFVSHLYLRLANDEPLIAYQQCQGETSALAPGMRVRARWSQAANHFVRD
jgi:ABC-type Fe3+/spermidine/putrescine transport system ATPase subunit